MKVICLHDARPWWWQLLRPRDAEYWATVRKELMVTASANKAPVLSEIRVEVVEVFA